MNSRMHATARMVAIVIAVVLPIAAKAQDVKPSVALDRFIAPAFPYDLVASRDAARIAWVENERGARNVYTASMDDLRPRRLTNTTTDDGVDLRPLRISADGSIVVYIRGHAPGIGSRPEIPGRVANPAAGPDGGRTEVWAAVTSGSRAPWRVASADNFELAPDGKSVVFVQDGQIHCAPVRPGDAGFERCRPEKPLVHDFGTNLQPTVSPDGRRIAYVSRRDDHSFVAVYDTVTERITYLHPGVDHDSAPTWSPDSQRLAFLRRPGRSYAKWPEVQDAGAADALPEGFDGARLVGRHTLSIWVADVESGTGRELWRAPDSVVIRDDDLRWLGNDLVFAAEPEGWRHLFALAVDERQPEARLLTPGEGEVEHIAASRDGGWLYFTANFDEPERRQLWRVSVADGNAARMTQKSDIVTSPAAPGSGNFVAVLEAGTRQPLSVALVPRQGGTARRIAPQLPADFPRAEHVEPEAVTLIAEDGVASRAQLMLPPRLSPDERRPALLFIHGGPRQQTLLGYHYQGPHGFYHLAYAVSQYFANKGYVTLSVNYRSGIGYGRAFREAPERGENGNSEYRDVLAAGRWLQNHPHVDPARVGVWGLSYGGMLTTQALARHSEVFAAGVSIGGFTLWEWSLDPASVSFRASPVAAIDSWRSPVLLIHGDDDRNVDFSYNVALVQLLRAQEIPFELMVFPNETHYFLVWQRWVETFQAMDDFFDRTLLREGGAAAAAEQR